MKEPACKLYTEPFGMEPAGTTILLPPILIYSQYAAGRKELLQNQIATLLQDFPALVIIKIVFTPRSANKIEIMYEKGKFLTTYV